MPPKIFFPVEYNPGPYWKDNEPVTRQPLEEHGHYMHELFTQGILVWGGAFTAESFSANGGGLNIFAASSLEEAEMRVKDDPAIKKGICVYKIRPWMPLLRVASQAENYLIAPAG